MSTPDPAEVIADAMHAFCTGRYSTAENAVEDLLHILEAEGYRIVRTDPDPDETQEAWLNDACSVIGNHCGSDGSDDDHNDWIGDLAHALWDTLGDGPLVERIAEVVAERDALAARLDSILDAIGDPDELRWHRWHCDDTGNGDDLRDLLVRIADAADPDRSEHGNLRPLTAEDEAIIEDVRRSVQPRPGVSTMDLTEDRLCPEVPVPTEPTPDPDRSTEP